jgi:hypothetical protein
MNDDRTAMYEKGRDMRPWRWALAEAVVGLALAWGAVWLFGRPAPAIDAPALVVALVAARYGYVAGVLTGLAAAAVALALAGLAPGGVLGLFADRAALATAFVYPLVGVLVGLVGDVPHDALRRETEERERLATNLEQASARYDVLLAAKEAVDRRVVGQVQTLASLYEAARELESLDPRQVPPAIARLLTRFIEAEAVSIYLGDGGHPAIVAAVGEHPGRSQHLDLAAVIAAEADGAPPDAEGAWLMAALLRTPDGRPRGAILVERLPFRQHTAGTRQMVALVADWASRALANSEAYASAREAQRDHPVTGIRRGKYMEERLIAERSAARRYSLALSLIMIRAPYLPPASDEEAWAEAAAPIAAELKRRIRTNDVAGHFRADDGFLLILPCTPPEGARVLAGRIEEALPGTAALVAAFETPDQDADAVVAELLTRLYPVEEARLAG